MKTLNVVAAVILSRAPQGNNICFATQRGYGDFKGGWEFPGGKIEEGETPKEALKREILEELEIDIEVGDLIHTVEYDYPSFHLSMQCFLAKAKGEPVLKEHMAAAWLTKEELDTVKWLPADVELVDVVRDSMT